MATGVRSILKNNPDLEIVTERSDGPEAVRTAGDPQPDLVLPDIQLPGLNGFVVAEQISKTSPHTRILFLTADRSVAFVRKGDTSSSIARTLDEVDFD